MIRKASILSIVLLASPALAATYNLTTNDDWQSVLQSSVAVSDVVNLASGDYYATNGNVAVTGRWVRVVGAGRTSSIVHAATTSRVFNSLVNFNGSGLSLKSLTITGGNVTGNGGGVLAADQARQAKLDDCLVISNSASGEGGGVFSVLVENSEVSFNTAGNGGGGRWVGGSNNLFFANVSSGSGGGTYNGYLTNCVVNCNTSGSIGAAFYAGFLNGGQVVSNNCRVNYGGGFGSGGAIGAYIAWNTAPMGGGTWSGAFTNCIFYANSATGTTGGAASVGSFFSCTFSNNWAKTTGGGLQDGAADSCLFANNYSLGNGSAAYVSILRNCTVVNHTNLSTITINQAANEPCANLLMWNNASNTVVGTNVINCVTNVDPLFLSGTFIPTSTNVVDKGDNTYATWGYDARMSNRVVNAVVDVGAYEVQATDAPAVAAPRRKMWFGLFGGTK